nr:unnamed protein product [Digitaria exilis]
MAGTGSAGAHTGQSGLQDEARMEPTVARRAERATGVARAGRTRAEQAPGAVERARGANPPAGITRMAAWCRSAGGRSEREQGRWEQRTPAQVHSETLKLGSRRWWMHGGLTSNKTTEAKALADTVLAATKGKAPYCLEACAKSVSSMADVLVDLPAKQDDMNAYLTAKNFRAKFKHEDPPICQKDCRNESSTADETLLANKFHNIWNVVKVANCQIEQMFPWPDSEDDDSDLA